MPYPNEHSCRLKEPIKDAETRRVNGDREHNGKKYDVIYQKQKEGNWEDQAFRYPKDTWEEGEARDHCKDHKGSFEPAEKEKGGTMEEERVEVTKESFSLAYPELFAEIQGESFKRGHDEGYVEGYGKGKADGAEAERNRIKEVEEQLIPGHESLIQELKYDGKTTGGEAAKLILRKESEILGTKAKEFQEEGKKITVADAIPPEVETEEDKEAKKKRLIGEYQKANPNASLKEATLTVGKSNPELFK